MLRRQALVALALLPLAGAGPHPRPNWDRCWWGMSPEQFAHYYPNAENVDGAVWLAASRIARAAQFANLIEPGSRVRFYSDGDGLRNVTFITPWGYDETMPRVQRVLGHQSEGEDTEARCFEADGARRSWDPSGVGHVLSICMGAATFIDRRRGNAVQVNGFGTPVDYRGGAFNPTPFQFIVLSRIDDVV